MKTYNRKFLKFSAKKVHDGNNLYVLSITFTVDLSLFSKTIIISPKKRKTSLKGRQ